MKTTTLCRFACWLAAAVPSVLSAAAITFTTNTTIDPLLTNYEGMDLVVSNCTLTVDGTHSFASLQVLPGGVVTHSFALGGTLVNPQSVVDEALVFDGTNVAWFAYGDLNPASLIVHDQAGTNVYRADIDYVLVFTSSGKTGLAWTFASNLPERVWVDYTAFLWRVPSGLNLNITGDVVIEPGAAINADGKGYGGGFGPGAGRGAGSPMTGSGASYGGNGGYGAGSTNSGLFYGRISSPTDKGSGGGTGAGPGGAGGGAIQLTVGGSLLLNGTISANGTNATASRSGGGSGGSIWLNAKTLAGAGAISAEGGAGEPERGGGGGGGRVALQYSANLFTGSVSAHGGVGYANGGAGTVYWKGGTPVTASVVVDNAGHQGMSTPVTASEAFGLTARNAAVVSITGSQSIASLHVASNACVSISNQWLTVFGDAIIERGGRVTADAAGNGSGKGPGAGGTLQSAYGVSGAGGGYGGYGASALGSARLNGGNSYGVATTPNLLGSGGGGSYNLGGAGGGIARLTVNGTLVVNGTISADGAGGLGSAAGGGSGGSVWLTVGTLAGGGTISANGGDGCGFGLSAGGGGGGGRIGIQYSANLFLGKLSARGGTGCASGGAGTIYLRGGRDLSGQVLVDNCGQMGTNTTLGQTERVSLTIRGGGVVASTGLLYSLDNLLVGSNSFLVFTNQGTTSSPLTVNSNVLVQAGGGIIADAAGSLAGTGRSPGRFTSLPTSGYAGGGGGHGGFGGTGATGSTGVPTGGASYPSSITSPGDPGSGGGGNSTSCLGGAGGGAIRLNVLGTLTVEGRLSANGGAGVTGGGGGGSGGSIWLTVGTLSGTGAISADGGAGSLPGGGGGGGRIAIQYAVNGFTGTLSAKGGDGFAHGGAGTVYTKPNNASVGLVRIDNGFQAGSNVTSLTTSGTIDLVVSGGALVLPVNPPSFNNLIIGSNSWLSVNTSGLITTSSNIIIQAGGGIIADGAGYSGNVGPGAGRSSGTSGAVGGGGGYGGSGGSGGTDGRAAGGMTYGMIQSPQDIGSGGGGSFGDVRGGAGGGLIQLNVPGTLTVDGVLSVNGLAGALTGSGGGSGGGIYLNVGTLSGSGSISANGGSGNGGGGGGGGGRIAIEYSQNAFSGRITAYGGAGLASGGAGTIFTKAKNQTTAQVLVDNGGRPGAFTAWNSAGSIDLTIAGGAAVLSSSIAYVGNLQIASNGWVRVTNQAPINVNGNAVIQAGGGINADGAGYPAGQGAGAGRYYYYSGTSMGGGGGYGGYGAVGGHPLAYGGNAYGYLLSPTDRGSGGAGPQNTGGAGGGMLRLIVRGTLLLDGRISANGLPGLTPGAGGGSGGAIWLTASGISGSGLLSANGGQGNWGGGGGGGGRVALQYGTSSFSGSISAAGGSGTGGYGGAGTIYTKPDSQSYGQVLVDNSGHAGTNTFLSGGANFDLTIQGGAVVSPANPYLTVRNLRVAADSALAGPINATSLFSLAVLGNALIEADGAIALDGKGYPIMAGPGAGVTSTGIGSGAGYGGRGGASSLLPGGITYGTIEQPSLLGSGGGMGAPSSDKPAGSEGGGALRLTVAGTFVLNGRLSANGNAGLQEDSGGGSGGSIWVNAAAIAGNGAITADGGDGELFLGGGGGGGRIAVYSPANFFTGWLCARGGAGFAHGEDGTIYQADSMPSPLVLSSSPGGVVNEVVSHVDLAFNLEMDPGSTALSPIVVTTPSGTLSAGDLTVTAIAPAVFRVSFPPQTAEGNYSVSVGPGFKSLGAQPLSQVYAGAFAIAWPTVQGTILDASGTPVAGVAVQPDGDLAAALTDARGSYSIKAFPGNDLSLVPSKAGYVFTPGSRMFYAIAACYAQQDFVARPVVVPALIRDLQQGKLSLSWNGVSSLTYTPFASTNLVDWVPCGEAMSGTNGLLQVVLPLDDAPRKFFLIRAE